MYIFVKKEIKKFLKWEVLKNEPLDVYFYLDKIKIYEEGGCAP